jgi:hypothetical protein
LATSPLRPTTNIFFQLNIRGYSLYVTSSLTRGWVYRLQLLLTLVSAVILGSESPGFMTIFYCLRFETLPTWRARSPYLYPTGTEWSSYNPRHWVPFSSPPTHRTTADVFEHSHTRCTELNLHFVPLKFNVMKSSDICLQEAGIFMNNRVAHALQCASLSI